MKNSIRNSIFILGGYQIFGGVLGLVLLGRALPQLQNVGEADMPLVIIAGLLYVYSALCGFVLIKSPRLGFTLSLVNQLLQVVGFSIGHFAYNFVAGFKLGIGIYFVPAWELKLNLSLSSFQFIVHEATGQVMVGVNLLALLLLYSIERLKNQ